MDMHMPQHPSTSHDAQMIEGWNDLGYTRLTIHNSNNSKWTNTDMHTHTYTQTRTFTCMHTKR